MVIKAGYPFGYPALNHIPYEKKKNPAHGHLDHRFYHHFFTDIQELGTH
jgi:hypothetical protein